jgi:hypothetical protein
MKKLALVGAAGLAALSMSCSDSKDTPSGVITGHEIAGSATAGYSVKGTVTADDGNAIASITLLPENAVLSDSTPDASGSTANFDVVLTPVCIAAGEMTMKVTITARFTEGEAVEVVTKTHVCEESSNTDINKKTIDVGGTGVAGSFVDLDGGTAYTSGQLAANVGKIDIVYAPGFITGQLTRIYSSDAIVFDNDVLLANSTTDVSKIFRDHHAADANYEPAIIWTLSNTDQATVKAATKWADLSDIIAKYDPEDDIDDAVSFIEATPGVAFIVFTTGDNYHFVVVNSASASTMEILSMGK